jgi:hypothetical protein
LRFGIAAPVLVVLAAGMPFGGKGSWTVPGPHLPSNWQAASDDHSAALEADAATGRSANGEEPADVQEGRLGWRSG